MPYDPLRDSETLYTALHAKEVDVNTIIDTIGTKSRCERLTIKEEYSRRHGNLVDDIKAKLTSDSFGRLVTFMFYDKTESDARFLNEAMERTGTDDDFLIQILTSRSNYEIRSFTAKYASVFSKRLEQGVIDETSGDFQRFMVMLLKAARDEYEKPSSALAKQYAKELYDAGERKLGTNEDKFMGIFSKHSFEQLKLVIEEYEKISEKTIIEALKSEFSGNLATALLEQAEVVIDKVQVFAAKFRKSMIGLERDFGDLARLVITLEDHLDAVKRRFFFMYGYSLYDCIKKYVSGNYGVLLLEIVGNDTNP